MKGVCLAIAGITNDNGRLNLATNQSFVDSEDYLLVVRAAKTLLSKWMTDCMTRDAKPVFYSITAFYLSDKSQVELTKRQF